MEGSTAEKHVTEEEPTYTLTIFAFESYRYFLPRVTSAMASIWEEQGKSLNIDTTFYHYREREARLARLRVEIMAGQAPDIIFLNNDTWAVEHSLRNFFTSGVFTCFYALIDNTPHLNRSDFYTNVLEAWEHEGRLYALPLTFGFEYAGINANLPQSIIDRFSALDTITMHELLRIYLDLKEMYDEFEHFYIFRDDLSPFYVLSHSMNGFVDYRNRTSGLNDSGFVALLDDWQQVFNGRDLFKFEDERSMGIFMPRTSFRNLSRFAQQYVFIIEAGWLNPANALIPNATPYFLHHIPITDEQGRLRMGKTWLTPGRSPSHAHGPTWRVMGAGHMAIPMISASADVDLAWEYVQHLIYVINYLQQPVEEGNLPRASLLTPIIREHFLPVAFSALQNSMYDHMRSGQDIIFASEAEQAEAFEIAIARLAAYSEMPVTSPFMIPRGLYGDLLDTFLRTPRGSVFGAQQTAQELHNRVSLWLIE